MIAVHDIFVCKPGNASKLAALFKEWVELEKKEGRTAQVMTDMTGQFHRVIMASQHESFAAYEENSKNIGSSPEQKDLMEKFKDMNEMYHSGSREVYKIW